MLILLILLLLLLFLLLLFAAVVVVLVVVVVAAFFFRVQFYQKQGSQFFVFFLFNVYPEIGFVVVAGTGLPMPMPAAQPLNYLSNPNQIQDLVHIGTNSINHD